MNRLNKIMLTIIFLLAYSMPIFSQCSECVLYNVNVGSGYDHENQSYYGQGSPDQYWRIVQGPASHGPYPKCAISQGVAGNGLVGNITCTRISINGNGIGDGNMQGGVNNCQYNDAPYVFQRDFCVNTGAGNPSVQAIVNLRFLGDLNVSDVRIIGPSGTIILSNTCWPQMVVGLTPTTVNLVSGVHTLQFSLGNDWDWTSIWSGWTTQTAMSLQVEGAIISGTKIFNTDKHFGKNVGMCAPAYTPPPVTPTFTNWCAAPGSSTANVQINGYVGSPFIYNVSPSATINTSNGIFPGNVGTTYTVTVSDTKGCTLTSTVYISPVPDINFGAPVLCSNTFGASLAVTAYSNGVTPPFTFSNSTTLNSQSGIPAGVNYSEPITTEGIYTLQVTDANNCTNTGTFIKQYVQENWISMIQQPCSGQPITLTLNVTSIPASPSYTYNWSPGPLPNSNTVTVSPLTSTVYTCVATSTYGCPSNNYLYVTVLPNPDVTVTDNTLPCSATFTASINTVLPATYNWTGVLGSSTANPLVAPFSAQPNPPLSGTYTVTASDANGCTGTATGTYIQNPFCCSTTSVYPTTPLTFSSAVPYQNATSAQILQTFLNPPNFTITNANNIYFDGVITINQNITFLNCPNIRMMPGTRFVVAAGVTLTFDNCTLRAECNMMWDGIQANSSTPVLSKVQLINCTIRDMEHGVMLYNGSKIESNGSNFINNNKCLAFFNTPTNYDLPTGNCIVINNQFYSDGTNLLAPFATEFRGRVAIEVNNSRKVQIGQLVNNSYNEFRNFYCGIRVRSGSESQVEAYILFNNNFDNIQDEPGLNTIAVSEQTVLSNWNGLNQYNGSAIQVTPISAPLTPTTNHRLFIDYSVQDGGPFNFYNCDKAIVGKYTTAYIRHAYIGNTFLGIMFDNARIQQYFISENNIGDITRLLYGISVAGTTGAAGNTNITYNVVRTRWRELVTIFPVDISYSNFAISNNLVNINYNRVYMNSVAGTGIHVLNTGASTRVAGNEIYLTNNGFPNMLSNVPRAGIFAVNCSQSQFQRNELIGNNTLISNANLIEGMRIENSQNCLIECNDFKLSPMGLRVLGNCATGATSVRGNHFANHGNSMHFSPLLTIDGTFGNNIGTATDDNNNSFSQGGLFGGVLAYTVFRNTTNFSTNQIRTLPATLDNTQSGAWPNTNGKYTVNQNPGATVFPICVQYPSAQPQAMIANFSMSEALDIINEEPEFTTLPEEVQWMQERELYTALFDNEALRLSDPVLLAYYNSMLNTRIDNVVRIDDLIEQLSDSTIAEDSTAQRVILDDIETINNSITSIKPIELNEKLMNNYFIQWNKFGNENISESDRVAIYNLAHSCPAIEGPAVFKARALYAIVDPQIDYDDYAICNAAYQNKGGNVDILSEAAIDQKKLARLAIGNFYLYPNPADEWVTIEYKLPPNENGLVNVYDMVGRLRKSIALSDNSHSIKVDVSTLEHGVYVYKYLVNGKQLNTGKLAIK